MAKAKIQAAGKETIQMLKFYKNELLGNFRHQTTERIKYFVLLIYTHCYHRGAFAIYGSSKN
jgi:hypothetical protein